MPFNSLSLDLMVVYLYFEEESSLVLLLFSSDTGALRRVNLLNANFEEQDGVRRKTTL